LPIGATSGVGTAIINAPAFSGLTTNRTTFPPALESLSKRRVADPFIIADAGEAASLGSGGKTQLRRLMRSPLARCVPGDRIWVKESFIPGCLSRDRGLAVSARLRDAEFATMSDGWTQFRDGGGRAGRRPTNRSLIWTPAFRMPRWSSSTSGSGRCRISTCAACGRRD